MPKNTGSHPAVDFVLNTGRTYLRVGAPRSAAALSYFLILTIFPLLLCISYIIGLFHLDLEQLMSAMSQILPRTVMLTIRDYLSYATAVESPALFWVGAAATMASASAGLRTLFRTMDELYGVQRGPGFSRFLSSIVLSFLLLPTIYLSVVVIFTGDWFFWWLQQALPSQILVQLPLDALSRFWQRLRYLLLFCFVLLLVLVVYRIGTPKPARRTRGVALPAFFTAAALAACSALFSWFIDMSTRYTLLYGSLASIIVLLVWLYFCGSILLLGAVIDCCQRTRSAAQRAPEKSPPDPS